MLLRFFKYPFLLTLMLMINGCIKFASCKSSFSVDKLPDATINQPYSAEIKIWGGAMVNENNINWEITPENSGLFIDRLVSKESVGYDGVILYGTPKERIDIKIHLEGGGYGYPPCFFDKTYILKVNAPSNDLKEAQ